MGVGTIMRADELLRQLAIQANNCIMKGNYTGDDIHEASEVMKLCIAIVDTLDAQQKAENASS